jgi:hypothetical protein
MLVSLGLVALLERQKELIWVSSNDVLGGFNLPV